MSIRSAEKTALQARYPPTDLVFTSNCDFRLRFSSTSLDVELHVAFSVPPTYPLTPYAITSMMVNPALRQRYKNKMFFELNQFLEYQEDDFKVLISVDWLQENVSRFLNLQRVECGPTSIPQSQPEPPPPPLPPSPLGLLSPSTLPPPTLIDYRGFVLSWPIWHNLPLVEKSRIAKDQNMSVGDFEEQMILMNALYETATTTTVHVSENIVNSSPPPLSSSNIT